jgi:hypothetical protein
LAAGAAAPLKAFRGRITIKCRKIKIVRGAIQINKLRTALRQTTGCCDLVLEDGDSIPAFADLYVKLIYRRPVCPPGVQGDVIIAGNRRRKSLRSSIPPIVRVKVIYEIYESVGV